MECDVLAAGEDVLDYHARIELQDRGPVVHPAAEATVRVNDQEVDFSLSLVPDDTVVIGAEQLHVRWIGPPAPEREWWLHASKSDDVVKLGELLEIGRAPESGIQFDDDHVSRNHAQVRCDGNVWLTDLGSANGTFVNGERVIGSVRLFHGDFVSFDRYEYQLIGTGDDLTPVRRVDPSEPEEAEPIGGSASLSVDTTEIDYVAANPEGASTLPQTEETGAFFLGVNEPVTGLTFRISMGRTVIGRENACDVVLNDPTVSAKHAEVVMRPESCTVTNMMATNGTRVNGDTVSSVVLADGDVLRFGRVTLVYKDVPTTRAETLLLKRTQWMMLLGSIALAGVLTLLIFL